MQFFSDWTTLKHEVTQGSILGPLLFIIQINYLPLRVNSLLEPIICVDDTSFIFHSKNFDDFCTVSDLVLSHASEWFAANKLVSSQHKTSIIKFVMNNLPQCALGIGYKEKCIEEM